MNEHERNNLQETITHAIEEMKKESELAGRDPDKINLAELERRTGISRKRLRKIQKDGFIVKPNGNTGRRKQDTVLTDYTHYIDTKLEKAVTNSAVIFGNLQQLGYSGGRTQVKQYIHDHKYLVPAPREVVSPQGNRGRRYQTGPGESYQMDWGFLTVDQDSGDSYRVACFAMMCHHCGKRYIEFFPNAKQENLFIGMIHAFQRLGMPKYVLTDNMKSVVNGRNSDGRPIWNNDYETFMTDIGFETKLCKPRHPFTKGAVEHLIRFVKDNFAAGRTFANITELNYEALKWCDEQDGVYHQCVDCIPSEKHARYCMQHATELVITPVVDRYLHPERKITFDGFVSYEGRKFGVPYSYRSHVCRVMRKDFTLYIYSDDLEELLTTHDVTWSRRDSYCKDQFVTPQPEEFPTMPVKVSMREETMPVHDSAFDRFNFDTEDICHE